MKKLFFFLVFWTTIGIAQKTSVQWTEVDEDKTPMSPDYVFLTKDRGIISLSYYKQKKYILTKIDNNLNTVFSNEVVITGKKVLEEKNLSFVEAFTLKGKHTIFTKYFDKKEKKLFVYSCSFNDNGEMDANYKVLASFPAEKMAEAGSVKIQPSQDSSKLVVFMDKTNKRNENQSFFVSVLNSTLDVNWEGEITIPYLEKNYDFEEIYVGNDAKVYSFGSCKKDCGNESLDKGETIFILNGFDNKGKSTEYILDLNDKFLFTPKIEILGSGDISCAGFYCNKRKRNVVNGIVFYSIDPATKKVKSSNMKEFTANEYKEFMSEKKAERFDDKDKGLSGKFRFRKFYPRIGGGGIMLSEVNYVDVRAQTSGSSGPGPLEYQKARSMERYMNRSTESGLAASATASKTLAVANALGAFSAFGGAGVSVTTYTYIYHFGPIAIFNIKPNGDIDWVRGLIKDQVSVDDNGPYSSFASMTYKDKIILIWNDSEKNLEKQEDEDNDKKKAKTTKNFKKAMGVMAIFSDNGSSTKSILFDGKEEELILKPKACVQISPNEMILYASKGKKDKIGKLVITE